jgi:peptidyl-prolyl isomerase G (cyclophilin G)
VGPYKLCYTGTRVHKIVDHALIQCGDVTLQNGKGGHSIYGKTFPDENFMRHHSCAGLLSMASRGRDTNNSQFYITLKATPHLDDRCVVFGQVIHGMEVVRQISRAALDLADCPRIPIVIFDSGEIDDIKAFMKYDPFGKDTFEFISRRKQEIAKERTRLRNALTGL